MSNNWTKTPPQGAGAYYHSIYGLREVKKSQIDGRLLVLIPDIGNIPASDGRIGGEWCGPLIHVSEVEKMTKEVEKAYREGWNDRIYRDVETREDECYSDSRARRIVEGKEQV